MSLIDTIINVANTAMNTKASQIRDELRAECPRSAEGHNGKHVADSFKIMRSGEGAAVSASFGGGRFIKSIIIGSTELGAYYANYGNGGSGRVIYPARKNALKLKDGSIRGSVHGYSGDHFIERVADRHR